MNQEGKSLFPDEESTSIPKKPKSAPPESVLKKNLTKVGSLAVAYVIWLLVNNHLQHGKKKDIYSLQSQAEEAGRPLVISTTQNTLSARVNEIITGEEKPKNTVIINPTGQEPAVQVITPDATITASKTGEVETITPKKNTTEKPLSETEAQSTVKDALNDAVEKTLPREEPLMPTEPQEKKK